MSYDHLPFNPDRVTLPPGYRMVPVGSRYRNPDDESARAVGIMFLDHPATDDADLPDERSYTGPPLRYGTLETGWLEDANCRTPEALAVLAAAAIIVNDLHEVMEFVRVDGVRVFNPHPGDYEEQWEWMQRRVDRLLADYRRAFPTEPQTMMLDPRRES